MPKGERKDMLAFEITEDDVRIVLKRRGHRNAADTAPEAFEALDLDRIEDEALKVGISLESQVNAAYEEIHCQLVEQGLLQSPESGGE